MVEKIKNLLLKHYLSNNGLVACTEFSNGADIFSINKNHYSTEIEIKTNRADLQRELRLIKEALNIPPKSFNKYGRAIDKNFRVCALSHLEAKTRKHYRYVVDKTTKITNYYVFCVVEELVPLCAGFLQEHNLSYGLLSVEELPKKENYLQEYFLKMIIKPGKLQNNKCPQCIIEKVARRACWEAYNLRMENY